MGSAPSGPQECSTTVQWGGTKEVRLPSYFSIGSRILRISIRFVLAFDLDLDFDSDLDFDLIWIWTWTWIWVDLDLDLE